MELGKQFRYIRQRKGFSIEAVAHDITSVGAICEFESGRKDMPIGKLQSLLNRMNVSLSQFANTSDRLSQESRDERNEIHSAFMTQDASRLRNLFETPMDAVAEDAQLIFFDHMLIAGKYYRLTGESLCTQADVTRLTDTLLATLTWDDSAIDVLYWTLPLMNDNRAFMLSREVLSITGNLEAWNVGLYGSAWHVVLEGLVVLMERRSNFAMTLLRQIETERPIAEFLIANRLRFALLKAALAVQKDDTPETREQVQKVIQQAHALGSREMDDQLRVICERTIGYDF